MDSGLPNFSDYIVFVDESGSPTLSQLDPDYPIFVLVFCVVNKWTYADKIQPAVKRLKFEFFGHDMIVLHSHDIRKPKGDFRILQNKSVRERFLSRIDELVANADIHLIVQIVDKREWKKRIDSSFDPYHVALRLGLSQLDRFLSGKGQKGRLTHIIAESRGKTEDRELGFEFHRFYHEMTVGGSGVTPWSTGARLDLKFVEKKINSAGLQLADLAAHPIGRHYLKPDQDNHAFKIIESKIFQGIGGFP